MKKSKTETKSANSGVDEKLLREAAVIFGFLPGDLVLKLPEIFRSQAEIHSDLGDSWERVADAEAAAKKASEAYHNARGYNFIECAGDYVVALINQLTALYKLIENYRAIESLNEDMTDLFFHKVFPCLGRRMSSACDKPVCHKKGTKK